MGRLTRSILGAALIVGLLAVRARAAEPALTPVGSWKTVDDASGKVKSVIRIFEENGKLYGKIEKLFAEPNEEANPLCDKCEGELKNKPILGMTILHDLERDGDEWSGGRIMDPDNGKTYKCYIAVMDGGAKLKVRGYIGVALLGRTQYWLREPSP